MTGNLLNWWSGRWWDWSWGAEPPLIGDSGKVLLAGLLVGSYVFCEIVMVAAKRVEHRGIFYVAFGILREVYFSHRRFLSACHENRFMILSTRLLGAGL
jgi:hypothetical protein